MQETNIAKEFTRKRRIGINPLTIDEGATRFLEVNSENVETMFSKTQEKDIPLVLATDLKTGEEGHFWLSGQLRHQLSDLATSRKSLKGLKLEITHKGQKTVEIDGEKVKVNQYDLYELN